jgi:hypothetical protein
LGLEYAFLENKFLAESAALSHLPVSASCQTQRFLVVAALEFVLAQVVEFVQVVVQVVEFVPVSVQVVVQVVEFVLVPQVSAAVIHATH